MHMLHLLQSFYKVIVINSLNNGVTCVTCAILPSNLPLNSLTCM